jgi:hypothetical protein
MTAHRHKVYRKPFSGRCLDGPFEGEWIEEDQMFFYGAYQRPMSPVIAPYDPAALASASLELPIVLYTWLRSYRAWAWVQPSGKVKNADAA